MANYNDDLNNSNTGEETIDIKKIFLRMLEFWPWFVASVIIALACTWAINKLSAPAYKASASVLIKDDSKRPVRQSNLVASFDIFGSQKNLQNEIGILVSNLLNQQTVLDLDLYIKYMYENKYGRKYDLYRNSPFILIPDTSVAQLINVDVVVKEISKNKVKISYTVPTVYFLYNYSTNKASKLGLPKSLTITKEVKFFEKYKDDFFSFKVIPNEKVSNLKNSRSYLFKLLSADALTQSYKSRLKVEPINKEATLVQISIVDEVAERAENYLNMLTSNYIDMGLAEKNVQAEKTIEFIDKQLSGITDSLQNVEMKLEGFRSEHNITDLSFQGQAIYKKLQDLEYERAMEHLKVGYYEYLLKYVVDDSSGSDLIAPSAVGITDPLFNQLIIELARLFSTREQLRMTSTSKNPFLLELDNQIESTRRTIVENVKNTLSNSRFILKEKEKQLDVVKKELSSLPKTERQFIQIQRMFTINDQIYTFLLEKRSEAAIAKASSTSDNKIIDVARVEKRIKPKKKQNYMIAFILGLLIPASIIFLMDQLRNKITDITDVEKLTTIPILGNVAHDDGGCDNVENISGKVVESFRAIRTNLDFFAPNKNNKVFAISSVQSGEGKSFSAFHLAYVFALAGKKTILISADIRKPDTGQFFNSNINKGLSTFLSRRDKWEDIVNKSKIENLEYVVSGPVPPNPAELLSSENVDYIIQQLSSYEIVVMDTSPIGIIADAAYLLKKSDVVLFVSRYNVTAKNDFKVINQIIDKLKLSHTALFCNDLKKKSRSNYYNYYYYSK